MGSIHGTSIVCLIAMVLALSFTRLEGLSVLSTTSESGRLLLEIDNFSGSNRQLDDTVRPDPLDNLRKYRGGYDITNKHYWSSTIFTGILGYTIAASEILGGNAFPLSSSLAAIWVLCGVGYGVFLIITSICFKRRGKQKKKSHCHKQCYLPPLLLAIFFTLLAITACGLVLGGNAKFNGRAKTVIDIIIDRADEASETIYNTTGAMRDMSTSLGQVSRNSEATRFLTSTSQRLEAQAADIQTQASTNRRLIEKVLSLVYIITTTTITLTLVSVIALLVFGVLKFHKTVQVLIAVCWIFTIICSLFFGVYFFLQNFVGDTCTALEGFQQNPYNNSFSSILHCDELLSARSVLDDVSTGIYNLVNEVNNNISRSYGDFVQICNSFSPPPTYEYQPWNCPSTSIRIGDIPHVLRMLVCPDSQGGTCNGGIVIPATYYNTVEAYSSSIQCLLDVYPDMESLVECEIVTNAFSEILEKHCNPLKRYVRMVWVGSVFLSVVLAALVLEWITGKPQEKIRYSLGGSVKPHSIDTLECGMTKDSVMVLEMK